MGVLFFLAFLVSYWRHRIRCYSPRPELCLLMDFERTVYWYVADTLVPYLCAHDIPRNFTEVTVQNLQDWITTGPQAKRSPGISETRINSFKYYEPESKGANSRFAFIEITYDNNPENLPTDCVLKLDPSDFATILHNTLMKVAENEVNFYSEAAVEIDFPLRVPLGLG